MLSKDEKIKIIKELYLNGDIDKTDYNRYMKLVAVEEKSTESKQK